MNTDIVDKLLRKAPPVQTPPGLLRDLQSNIALPPSASRIAHRASLNPEGWFRRWMPALGFALWFLGCIVVFGIQASRIAELKEQNLALPVANAAAAEPTANAEAPNAANAVELERLRKDLSDVWRLRAEIEQLRSETQELAPLRAQNRWLREELKVQAASPPKPEEDFFTEAASRPARLKCINNLKQVGLAARLWANASKTDAFPSDKAQLIEFLGDMTAKTTLMCPADGTTSYEILSPGASENDPGIVYVHCPIHNNVGLVDGSAHMLGGHRKLLQRDGKWIVGE